MEVTALTFFFFFFFTGMGSCGRQECCFHSFSTQNSKAVSQNQNKSPWHWLILGAECWHRLWVFTHTLTRLTNTTTTTTPKTSLALWAFLGLGVCEMVTGPIPSNEHEVVHSFGSTLVQILLTQGRSRRLKDYHSLAIFSCQTLPAVHLLVNKNAHQAKTIPRSRIELHQLKKGFRRGFICL